jgi:DNA-binding MarR family transcriptional regulator
MERTVTLEQAEAIASHLPGLIRRLFASEGDLAEELPLGQLRVCAVLYEAPRPMSALSRELGVSLSATTQIADRLERAGLVQRVAEENDRRVKQLQLTGRGEDMMRRREEARVRRVLAVLEHLSPAARQDVLATFEKLSGACEAVRRQERELAQARA